MSIGAHDARSEDFGQRQARFQSARSDRLSQEFGALPYVLLRHHVRRKRALSQKPLQVLEVWQLAERASPDVCYRIVLSELGGSSNARIVAWREGSKRAIQAGMQGIYPFAVFPERRIGITSQWDPL